MESNTQNPPTGENPLVGLQASTTPILAFRDEHRFLSNFWPVPNGIQFQPTSRHRPLHGSTVEHLYQALKTTDLEEQDHILQLETPGRAKRYGQTVTIRDDWELIKVAVMIHLQAAKYRDPTLRDQLLSTGERPILEGNTWCDIFWGVCHCPEHNSQGENWMGRIVELTRSQLHLENI